MMASTTMTTTSAAARASTSTSTDAARAQLHPSLEQGRAYLDALPYVDGELDPLMRAHVDRLVLAEMQNPRFPRK